VLEDKLHLAEQRLEKEGLDSYDPNLTQISRNQPAQLQGIGGCFTNGDILMDAGQDDTLRLSSYGTNKPNTRSGLKVPDFQEQATNMLGSPPNSTPPNHLRKGHTRLRPS